MSIENKVVSAVSGGADDIIYLYVDHNSLFVLIS